MSLRLINPSRTEATGSTKRPPAGLRSSGLAFLLTALCFHVTADAAEWTNAADMAAARAQHGSALLDDGSVLVVDGVRDAGFVADAERYAPASDSWTSGGQPGIQGNVTQAELLPTGQVLAITDGGTQARRFDPSSGTWSDAGTLATRRSIPTLTLLGNGKVLVAGGTGTGGVRLQSAELYDPVTNSWRATGSMRAGRGAHVATLLRDGRVLVVSGFSGAGEVPGAELYDPLTETWSDAAAPRTPRHYASLTLLPDGRVLLAGGFGSSGALSQAEIYDPAVNTWTATGSLAHARQGHMATLLQSGLVLVTGGSSSFLSGSEAEAELYDPATGSWQSAGSMATGRENHSATWTTSGDVLVAGGYSSAGSLAVYRSAERYVPPVAAGPAPVIDAMPLLQKARAPLVLAGTGFTGATGTALPRLQLRRIANGASTELTLVGYSATGATTTALPALPAGLYAVSVVSDDVPSAARLIQFTDAPGTPAATAADGTVALQWSPPANDGGNPPVGYEVTSLPSSAGCTSVAPATGCTVAGLANGSSYVFSVHAVHANGDGPPSASSLPVIPGKRFTGTGPGDSGPVTATLAGGGDGCTFIAGDTGIAAAPPGTPASLRFPYGVFRFKAENCTPNGPVQVSLTYATPLPAQAQFWKYGPAAAQAASSWFNLGQVLPVTVSSDRMTVTYTIADNSIGDADPTPGRIEDPFGPALAVDAQTTAIPALSSFALGALALLLGGLATIGRRRKGR